MKFLVLAYANLILHIFANHRAAEVCFQAVLATEVLLFTTHLYAGAVLIFSCGQGVDLDVKYLQHPVLCCKLSWPGKGCFCGQSCRKANFCSIHKPTGCCLIVSPCLSSLSVCLPGNNRLVTPLQALQCSHGSLQPGLLFGAQAECLQVGGVLGCLGKATERRNTALWRAPSMQKQGSSVCLLRCIPVCIHVHEHLHVCHCTSKLASLLAPAAPHSG